MASASAEETFSCSKEQFYKVITDYEKYSDFLNEVKNVSVIERQENRVLCEFGVSMVKEFKYRLWITEEPGSGIHWTFDSGDIFKESTGSWKLTEEDGKVHASYEVAAKFKIFVPGPIAKALVKTNLPAMMSSYHKRIGELYG